MAREKSTAWLISAWKHSFRFRLSFPSLCTKNLNLAVNATHRGPKCAALPKQEDSALRLRKWKSWETQPWARHFFTQFLNSGGDIDCLESYQCQSARSGFLGTQIRHEASMTAIWASHFIDKPDTRTVRSAAGRLRQSMQVHVGLLFDCSWPISEPVLKHELSVCMWKSRSERSDWCRVRPTSYSSKFIRHSDYSSMVGVCLRQGESEECGNVVDLRCDLRGWMSDLKWPFRKWWEVMDYWFCRVMRFSSSRVIESDQAILGLIQYSSREIRIKL